ncbi:MAG: hypothetical protein LBG98_02075 [Puniceicoccales bacterium]|nr:hypothetical protein [Puniceicoccales bacterium]
MLLVLSIVSGLMLGIIFMSSYLELVRERQRKRRTYNQLHLCAEYALQDAFQHLQSVAAQDQRVTARANILDNGSERIPSGQELWTGVWRTELDGVVQDIPSFCSWLVSHEHETDGSCKGIATEDFCRVALADKFVWGVDDPASKQTVCAPFVSILDTDGNAIGRYAYWIEDESQKACCTLPYREDLYLEVVRSCPPQCGIDFLDGLSLFPQKSSQLSACGTLKEIEVNHTEFHITGAENTSVKGLMFYEHDLTCCSKGLLTDSRSGGLRKDLSAFFQEGDTANTSYPPLSEGIFHVSNDDPEPVPVWGILKSFALMCDSISPQKISPQLAARSYAPIDYKDYSSWNRGDLPREELQIPDLSPLTPIMSNFSLLIQVRKTAWNSEMGTGILAFDFIPQVTLHNPNNVYLSSHEYHFRYRSLRKDGISNVLFDPPAIRAILSLPGDETATVKKTMALGLENESFWDVFSGVMALELAAGKSVTLGLGSSSSCAERNADRPWIIDGKGAFTHDWEFALPGEVVNFSSYRLVVERILGITTEDESKTNGWKHFYLFLCDENASLAQIIAKVPIEDATSRSVDHELTAIEETPMPLFGFSAYLKSNREADFNGNDSVRWLAEGNPRALWMGRSQIQDGEYMAYNPMFPTFTGNITQSNWHWKARWWPNETLTGLKIIAPENKISGILFDVPRKEVGILNLGFLQHANVTPFGYHPSCAIGNSLQPPRIPRESVFWKNPAGSLWSSHRKVEMLYDYSYLLNQALWDTYFLSTWREGKLLNPRLQTWKSGEDLSSLPDRWNFLAAKLYIQGAFNIHSTSVVAWFSVLCGSYDVWEKGISFGRFPVKDIGRVRLSREQLWHLSERIVVEIKNRGVFTGLADFVNRKRIERGAERSEQGIKGALQSAIDTALHAGEARIISGRNCDAFDDEAVSGDRHFGEPGYLTQADLLQSLGTFLTARGDTFIIHVYAELQNTSKGRDHGIRADVRAQRMLDEMDDPVKGRKFVLGPVRWSR